MGVKSEMLRVKAQYMFFWVRTRIKIQVKYLRMDLVAKIVNGFNSFMTEAVII